MINDLMRFVAVDFVDDNNVKGFAFWYLCEIDGVEEGDKVVAPLGRHNNLQVGVVKLVKYFDEFNAPYPLHSIKYIRKVLKPDGSNYV